MVETSRSSHQMASHSWFDREKYIAEVEEFGFFTVSRVVSKRDIDAILLALNELPREPLSRRGRVYAARNLLLVPAVAQLATAPEICQLVEPILGKTSFPVRGILFDKVPGANWHVGWHQDQIIPVAERKEVPGFTAWSVKDGVPHVRPPRSVLEDMLTLRIHLDDSNSDNGALKVIPGSHSCGLLDVKGVLDAVSQATPALCEAKRGEIIAMRPLLLHASAPAVSPTHRRVIHLEFAVDALPGGLKWPRWN